MEEMYDVYTRDGKWIGVKEKSFCHSENPGVYHKPAWIWIINSKNEILIQKRAACKKNFPNKWDMPSAGHVDAGERPIDGAIRETFEEIGIQTSEKDYHFICEYIWDEMFEIAQVYLLKLDVDINNFKLQEDEVAELKWLSLEEFKKIFYSDEFVPFKDDYRKIVMDMFESNLK